MGLRIGPGTWSLLDSGKKGWGCSDAFKESGIPEVLRSVLKARHYEFDVERAIYLTVLHRLFASGSDRAAERWREDYLIPGNGRARASLSLPGDGVFGRHNRAS
jgi:hypothetical protein